MDLNQLLFQHQSAILREAQSAPSTTGSMFDMVGHYKLRIDRLRRNLGVSAYPEWCASRLADAS